MPTVRSLLLRRFHLNDLPALTLPPGYRLRVYEPSDLAALAALLQAAFPERTWDNEHTEAALPGDATVQATFLLETETGKLAATASARLMPEAFPGSGYVHWVAVHPEQRGKKLGALITAATLHEFVRLGCRDAVLETDDSRVPALKTYLRLGFAPDMRHESHKERWQKLSGVLSLGDTVGDFQILEDEPMERPNTAADFDPNEDTTHGL